LDTLMRGPCWFCRKPMNWLAADPRCLPWCRRCVAYIGETGRRLPAYALLLVARANEYGMRRGERVRFVVALDERLN
jgi:hypothetical protein